MSRVISIPEELRTQPVSALRLSRRATNGLLAARLATLGDLDGKTLGEIGGMRGVGAQSLDEIGAALGRLAELVPTHIQNELGLEENGARPEQRVVQIAPKYHHWRLVSLGLPEQVATALRKAGFFTLGILHGQPDSALRALTGVGEKGVAAVFRAAAEINELPPLGFMPDDAEGPADPHAPLAIYRAVSLATSAEDEVSALLTGVGARNAEMIRARWTRKDGRLPTLEGIAARYGITRERVRQITDRHDLLLKNSNIRLKYFSRIANAVDAAGGVVAGHELVKRLEGEGVSVSPGTLELQESLAELGLVPQVAYSEKFRVWFTEKGKREWIESGALTNLSESLKGSAREQARRVSAIRLSDIASNAPLGLRHALSVALLRDTRFDRVGDYLVPNPAPKSDLTRAIYKMLAVAPWIPISDAVAGLQRTRVRRAEGTIRLDVPPPDVLEVIVRNSPPLTVIEGHVTSTKPVDAASTLSDSDKVLVSAIERYDGVAGRDEIIEAVQAAGYSFATARFLLQRPFVVRRASAVYSLRGRSVSSQVLRRRLKERDELRRSSIKSVSYLGGTSGRVVYEMTTFTLQGVLPIPSKFGGLVHKRWNARFPDGQEQSLRVSAHLLFPLKPWFEGERLKLGDLVMATYDMANGRIDFERIS